MKVRSFIVAAVAAISSFALLATPAHAAFCYDVEVNVNGDAVVDQAGCI